MDAATLVAELEPLAYKERVGRMVELGRRARTDATAAGAIDALSRGSFYQRQMALWSCAGSGDRAHVLRAAEDASALLGGLALHILPGVCSDAETAAILGRLPRARRLRFAQKLWRRGRRGAVQALLDELVGRDDPDAAGLLAYASETQARAYLARHADAMTDSEWAGLAGRHPRLAAGALRSRLEAAAERDPRLAWQASGAVRILTATDPDAAVGLVRVMLRHGRPSSLQYQLGDIANRRPDEVADLVLASDELTGVSFGAVAHRLSPDRLLALLATRPSSVDRPEKWLRRLPKQRRAEAWAAAAGSWRGADGRVSPKILRHLPPDLRHAEARRHLDMPDLAAQPAQHRLPYAALLPWDEALRAVEEALRSPDAADRGAALVALIGSARFEPGRLGDVLRLLLERKNEQAPVRLAALQAVAQLPPARWRDEHLDALTRVIDDALDAADTSAGVIAFAERLVVALLPFHPDWSARQLARLARDRGAVSVFALGSRLTDAQARRLAAELEPLLEEWESRERPQQLVNAAQSLGRQLRWFDRLTDALENALYELSAEWELEPALFTLFRHRPDRLPALVPAMLARDPSWITRSPIQKYLHARRQDLLTPFLGRQTFAGKFSTGRTTYVLPLRGGFWRWTAAQQAAFAQTLREVIGDEGRDTPETLQAVRQLAELPDPPPDRLVELAEGAGVKKAVRDTAIQALGRVEAGRGVEALMRALKAGDDGVRVAIYALRRSLLAMPPGRALAVLRGATAGGVTVSKEVVRLLGELPGDESFAELMAWHRRDLHRNVRVALLRALWGHLDRPEAWEVLGEAARSPDAATASVPMRIPVERLAPDGQRRLAGILADLLRHPDAKLRLETLQRCASQPISDPDKAMMPALLAAMGSEVAVEAAAAARAVFGTYAGPHTPLVAEAVRKIIPNRRAFKTAIHALRDTSRQEPSRALPTVRAVLAVLRADPLTAVLAARLAAQALPAPELAAYLRAAAVEGRLHAEALAAVLGALRGHGLNPPPRYWDDLEVELASDGDERLRRIALAALVSGARLAGGWTEAREGRLGAFRQDPSPLVASAAQFTFTRNDTNWDLEMWDDWTDLL